MDRIADSAAQIGRGIRKLRRQKKWKQDVLAEFSGINRATISQIELGKLNPSLFVLERLARALDTDVSALTFAARQSLRQRDPELIEFVGRQISELREERGYSRKQLAEIAGFLPQYIGTTENGLRLPTLVNLSKFAKALSVRPSRLVRGEVAENEKWVTSSAWEDLSFGARVSILRKERGVARQQIARLSGLDPQHLGKIESGKLEPTLPTLLAICRGIPIDISEVID